MVLPLVGIAAQAAIGGISSHAAAQAQEAAAQQAQRMAQRGYYSGVATQEPWRQAGYNALATIGGMYGWQPAPYATAQDLSATMTPLNAKQVRGLVKQGMSYDQIRQQGRLTGTLNPKAVKRLTRAGLSMDQIQGLSAAQVAQSAPPSVGSTTGGVAAPGGAGGAGGGGGQFDAFFASPDFQLRKQMAEEAIQRTAAAGSGALNPATMLAVGNRVGQMQGEEYGNWFNRLMQIANNGQGAANATMGAGSQYTGQSMNAAQAAGDARASGVLGIGNSISGAIGAGMDYYQMQQYLNKMPQPGTAPRPPTGGAPAGGYSPYGPYAPQYGGYQFPTRP